MRILLVSHVPKDPDAGSSRVYHLLEGGLKARGHQVTTLHYADFAIPKPFAGIIRRLLLPQAASRRAARELRNGYDVVMSSSGVLYPLFRSLQGQSNHPLIVAHWHGSSFLDNQAEINEMRRGHTTVSWIARHITGPLREAWDVRGSRYADITITQNGRDKDLAEEKGAAPVFIVPLPVHPDIMQAGKTSASAATKPVSALLWLGSWDARKGSFYLPIAFKKLLEHHPGATLTIGGVGSRGAAVLEAFDPTVRDRVTILPRYAIPQQIALCNTHSIFLFPSLSEGFGLALLEAMAMGLPVVTTNSGMGADWLVDRENAMIVPAASAHHLEAAILTLLADPELSQRLAQNGQIVAQQRTVGAFIDSYEQLFQQHLPTVNASA